VNGAYLLHQLVSRQAQAHPEARALAHPTGVLTYGALDDVSNQIARALQAAGCRRGDRVAFLLPRTPLTIAAMVGILKADCLYVPLDLRGPVTRLARVIGLCEPTVVLAGPAVEGSIRDLARNGTMHEAIRLGWMGRTPPSGPAFRNLVFNLHDVELLPKHPIDYRNGLGDPACILFTSGSTGTPRGVVTTHRNVDAFIEWAVEFFGLGPGDRLGGYTDLSFNLSTFDIHATFAAGAELHIIPDDLKLLPPKVVDLIRDSELTHWLSVPSFLEHAVRFDCLREGDLPAMRWVTWCGDVLPTPPLLHWMERIPHASFANLYGTTETTVASSCYVVPKDFRDTREQVPIGRACTGETLLVLDGNLRPVPRGETGHLYIGGSGLSPGYWRDPEGTREVFLLDPGCRNPSARVYRTGDLARVDDDGNVHFLGREDQQIKTRGFRVELGEVEAALRSLPGIAACAVVGFVREGFPGKLIGCAYVPSDGGSISTRDVRQRVAELLPDYMLPLGWKAVDHLPLSDRGKVDRMRIQRWIEEEDKAYV
jgi:amino acid adenylation domain-containing protein